MVAQQQEILIVIKNWISYIVGYKLIHKFNFKIILKDHFNLNMDFHLLHYKIINNKNLKIFSIQIKKKLLSINYDFVN
jgi:hypothetical protein